MNKIWIILIVVLAIALGIYVYSSKYGSSINAPQSVSNTNRSSAPVSGNGIVINNYTFSPSTLTVKKGTTVTWTNNDSVDHNIKSAIFNSKTLKTGDTYQFTFNSVGTFNYNCGIHPTMTGTVVVE